MGIGQRASVDPHRRGEANGLTSVISRGSGDRFPSGDGRGEEEGVYLLLAAVTLWRLFGFSPARGRLRIRRAKYETRARDNFSAAMRYDRITAAGLEHTKYGAECPFQRQSAPAIGCSDALYLGSQPHGPWVGEKHESHIPQFFSPR